MPLEREGCVADRINTPLYSVQSPGERVRPNRVFTDSKVPQLPDRDQSVLPFRNHRNSQVGCGDFPGHMPG
jgi:hypothetical protein